MVGQSRRRACHAAQSAMRELGSHVERILLPGQDVQIFRKTLPFAPGHTFVKSRAGDVFHPFHDLDQFFLTAGRHGRKAYAAVAHYHRRDTVRRGRVDLVIPGHLTIIVGMDVDPSGCGQGAIGLDDLVRRGRDLAQLRDLAVANPDVSIFSRVVRWRFY